MVVIDLPELTALQKSASKFRELVNEPRLHYSLFSQPKKFNLVCSAMDVIDDILFALHSYIQSDHQNQGLAYLEIFGVLQSLTVQQDAVSKLYKLVRGTPVDLEKEFPNLRAVRETRIRVAGHPVGGQGSSHFLVRYTVSKYGFELWKFDQTGNHTTETVSLPELIKKNSQALVVAIEKLIGHIEAEKEDHRAKYRGKSLADNFQNLAYFVEKIFEHGRTKNPMASAGIASIRDILKSFQADLEVRSDHYRSADFMSHRIPRLEYAFEKFESYMKGDVTQNENDAYVLATFIETEMNFFRDIAREIDAEYQSSMPGATL